MGWIVIAVLGVVAVLTMPKVPGLLYHWRRAAHLAKLTRTELVPAPEYGSMILAEEEKFRRALHLVDAYDPAEWSAADLAGLHDTGQRPRGMTEPLDDLGPGAGLYLSPGYNSRPDQSAMVRMKADSPAPDDLPREDGAEVMAPGKSLHQIWVADKRDAPAPGAGDESEGYGLTAPPASLDPMRPSLAGLDAMGDAPGFAFKIALPVEMPTRLANATDVALARCDAFIMAMRADHAVWLADARERWAAA